MAKIKKKFVCQNCGYSTPKWMGRCTECGEWNSFVEELDMPTEQGKKNTLERVVYTKPKRIEEIIPQKEDRFKTKNKELDRVLGGGIVPGGVILLGGDPGIGKSTILLQTTENLGSVSQIRENANALMQIAKKDNISMILVGHVTKEGNIAGPRVLEHMVDTVLYFEGEKYHTYRILRGVKNRFGSTNEIGIFEMAQDGLHEVANPSEMMLSSRPKNTCGSVVVPCMEGTRPLLIELQGLVSQTSFGNPRRMATGMDYNRMVLLLAIMEKRLGLQLQNLDAYINVVGGMKIDEPALDLAVVSVLYSSFRNFEIPEDMMIIGEVGLTGEVRNIQHIEKRLKEGAKLGFKRCIMPKGNARGLENTGLELLPVDNISKALNILK